MAKIFEITDDIKLIASNAIDDLIDQLGKKCELVYPAKRTACVNCTVSLAGGKSSNKYRAGGPQKFTYGLCPLCGGDGFKAESQTEIITMLLTWSPKDWVDMGFPIRNPDGLIQSKGYITPDLPKTMRAEYMIAHTDFAPHIKKKFKLYGEPADVGNIVQGRYFVALWKRVGV